MLKAELGVNNKMSSSKKQITIDPGSLSGGQPIAHNPTLKRQRKNKPQAALLRPSTVKKNLLEKIKDYKRHKEETPLQEQPHAQKSDKDLANQFKMSANYLEQLINKKKEARKQNKPKTPVANPVKTQPTMQPFQPTMQPFQPTMQPFQTTMQPFQTTMQPIQVSLDLPPELQINPMNLFYPKPIDVEPEPASSSIALQHAEPESVPIAPIVPPVAAQEPVMNQLLHNPSKANAFKDVPYGCLVHGTKPTYRTYHRDLQKHTHADNNNTAHAHKTMKKTFMDAPNPTSLNLNLNPENDPMIQERQRKLRELQERAAVNNASSNNAFNNPSNNASSNNPSNNPSNDSIMLANNENVSRPQLKLKNKIRQTITKKYTLGRAPGSNVVGVLIKNNETRRQVQQDHGVLRREAIVEIRKYLHGHGLLKVGSDAPPDVLRNMYETAKLTGEVTNVNKQVLLHNFIATADKESA